MNNDNSRNMKSSSRYLLCIHISISKQTGHSFGYSNLHSRASISRYKNMFACVKHTNSTIVIEH